MEASNEWELAKENFQPLKQGREPQRLNEAVDAPTPEKSVIDKQKRWCNQHWFCKVCHMLMVGGLPLQTWHCSSLLRWDSNLIAMCVGAAWSDLYLTICMHTKCGVRRRSYGYITYSLKIHVWQLEYLLFIHQTALNLACKQYKVSTARVCWSCVIRVLPLQAILGRDWGLQRARPTGAMDQVSPSNIRNSDMVSPEWLWAGHYSRLKRNNSETRFLTTCWATFSSCDKSIDKE